MGIRVGCLGMDVQEPYEDLRCGSVRPAGGAARGRAFRVRHHESVVVSINEYNSLLV